MLMSEAIMDKIAKLLAKAKGTTNENEAAIFAAKAAELLAEHNLTEAMVAAREANRDPIGEYLYEGRIADRFRELILMGCAQLYFCKLTKSSNGRRYTMYGREHNARVAAAMSEYLIATVKRLAREYSPSRVDQRDFRKGAGLRLYERLKELYKANMAPVAASGSNLPALYNSEAQAVQEYINKQLGPLRSQKARPMRMGYGAMMGRAAADKISLNTQLGAEKRASRMIGNG